MASQDGTDYLQLAAAALLVLLARAVKRRVHVEAGRLKQLSRKVSKYVLFTGPTFFFIIFLSSSLEL